ncbi:hypothetical protein BS78_01G249600 [Paspalum vaginatum]|uniref:Uncharacterized protein n=1 Tax=Paspalum vaginatum TaxID=158149 RepID=A0A9W7XB74_9POAL|nr:hypothetical protein BS78_K164000 [Paspalum vaginatum]KAJ1295791.1 hypothetical protein BS78_01G249600 [Paspalum vaginatum]
MDERRLRLRPSDLSPIRYRERISEQDRGNGVALSIQGPPVPSAAVSPARPSAPESLPLARPASTPDLFRSDSPPSPPPACPSAPASGSRPAPTRRRRLPAPPAPLQQPFPLPSSFSNRRRPRRQVRCPSPFLLPDPRKHAPIPPKKRQRHVIIRIEGHQEEIHRLSGCSAAG